MNRTRGYLTHRQQGGVTILSFLPATVLDETTVEAIGGELAEHFESNPRKRLLINLKGVEHLPSSVIGKLIALQKRAGAVHGELKLCAIEPHVLEILKSMRLDKLFEIHKDEPMALSKFRGAMIG